jgi:phospholipid/cholesterol/gamma-HCH transport system substrate-binding protein
MAVSREVKVGVFVFLGFVGAAAIIFLIGDNRSLFDAKVPFRAQFDDVQGVKPGSTVRMGGVDIGTVSRVQYPADARQTLIDVELSIVKREAERIRAGSRASIAPKGLLGDKMVNISAGHPDEPPIAHGGTLPTSPAEDFTQILGRLDAMTGTAKNVLENLEVATSAFAGEALQKDLRDGVGALSRILVSVDSGSGYVSKLLHDSAEAERLSRVIGNLEQTTARLDNVLSGVDNVLDRVNTGPGLAHEIIYGESGSQALARIGSAADELDQVLEGVREGNGLAHGLLFGDTGGGGDSALGDKVSGDLSAMSTDLRAMVNDLRQGKGTLGALLVDPSVYEDLKLLLGNVQRNQTLRALVRYSISRDAPSVEVVDPNTEERAAKVQPKPRSSEPASTAAQR